MRESTALKQFLLESAKDLGFGFCGVAQARRLDEEEERLTHWLKTGKHGKMSYMEKHFELRLDPRKLVPGAQSVIVLMYNYFNNELNQPADAPKISMYAYGEDYHRVIKDKLHELVGRLKEKAGDFNGRVFTDSAPVMERNWAALAGIGWTGKNSLLINPKAGSYFFLAEIISDLNLEPDTPIRDYCGTCTACMDACPTQAITPYVVDGARCISYLTIELKEQIPEEFTGKMENWAFGCDICQQVCPWNRFSKPNAEHRFNPLGNWPEWDKQQWLEMTDEIFSENFGKSAVKRAGREKVLETVRFLDNG